MPFKSEKQRRFMWAKHPEIAEEWAEEEEQSASPKPKHKSLSDKLVLGHHSKRHTSLSDKMTLGRRRK